MQVFRSGSGAFDTGELLEELQARGLLETQRRKVAMSAVRRACDGLVHRGLTQGQYEPDMGNTGRTTIQWSLTRSDD